MYTHTCTCMFNRTVDVRTRVKCLVGLDLRREPLYRRWSPQALTPLPPPYTCESHPALRTAEDQANSEWGSSEPRGSAEFNDPPQRHVHTDLIDTRIAENCSVNMYKGIKWLTAGSADCRGKWRRWRFSAIVAIYTAQWNDRSQPKITMALF